MREEYWQAAFWLLISISFKQFDPILAPFSKLIRCFFDFAIEEVFKP
jgi:hypothetical protein